MEQKFRARIRRQGHDATAIHRSPDYHFTHDFGRKKSLSVFLYMYVYIITALYNLQNKKEKEKYIQATETWLIVCEFISIHDCCSFFIFHRYFIFYLFH